LVRFRTWLAVRRFDVAMLEGDASGAEAAAQEVCETAQATGQLGNFMWFCCNLAQALLVLGRNDEAQWLDRGHETPAALLDLADVLGLAGQDPQMELEQALALYERKGNLVMAERTRSRLAKPTASR
jgi:hypothetical protein